MEDKVKRESKKYIEKMFKKYDTLNCGAVTKENMGNIIENLLSPMPYDQEELNLLMATHVKDSKYTIHNKQTNKFEVNYLKDSIDFPSAMAIAVRFLVKAEKANNQFSGVGLVKVSHFEDSQTQIKKTTRSDSIAQQKRRIF